MSLIYCLSYLQLSEIHLSYSHTSTSTKKIKFLSFPFLDLLPEYAFYMIKTWFFSLAFRKVFFLTLLHTFSPWNFYTINVCWVLFPCRPYSILSPLLVLVFLCSNLSTACLLLLTLLIISGSVQISSSGPQRLPLPVSPLDSFRNTWYWTFFLSVALVKLWDPWEQRMCYSSLYPQCNM